MTNAIKQDIENRMARDKSALFEGFDQERFTYDDNGAKMEIIAPKPDKLKDYFARPVVNHPEEVVKVETSSAFTEIVKQVQDFKRKA
jgi:hypothetical protein